MELDLFHEISQAAVDVVAALAIDPELLVESYAAATPTGAASESLSCALNQLLAAAMAEVASNCSFSGEA